MPRGDGTGPMGMGPMTGRGAGYCAGYNLPGFANYFGVGFGRGMGRGRGFRRMFYLTGIPGWARTGYTAPMWSGQVYDEKTALEKQKEFLEKQLEQVREYLRSFDEEK